jgi:hypothetical protein
MKRATRILAIVTVMMPMLAMAQLDAGQKLTANVPFEFIAGNQRIPAGECVVQGASKFGSAVAIRNWTAKVSMFSMISNGDKQQGAPVNALVFHKYGDSYFLSGIKLAGSQQMYKLPEGKAEAELQAQNVPVTEEVLLAQVK